MVEEACKLTEGDRKELVHKKSEIESKSKRKEKGERNRIAVAVQPHSPRTMQNDRGR